jgi:signal recognition particle receptor subunit alpha
VFAVFVTTNTKLSQYFRRLKMLDTFEILTTSGVVLWSKSYTPISPSIINSLVTNVFIEERTLPGAGIADDVSAANNPPYKHDQHTLKWTTVKELGLIFVVSCRKEWRKTLRR